MTSIRPFDRRATRLLPWLAIAWIAAAGCGRPEPGPAARPVDQSRAKSRYDARVFDGSLSAIVAWHDSSSTAWSSPEGPAAEAVLERFEDLDFTLNDELTALWRRLAPPADGPPFVLDHRLLSAAESRDRYDALRSDPDVPWRPNWIPVLVAGDRWLVVESSRSGAPAGPVVAYRDGVEPQVAFTNLTRLWQTIAVALRDPSATWADGRMQVDADALRRAHAEINGDLALPAFVLESR